MIFHTQIQLLRYQINQNLYSQKTPHGYGVSVEDSPKNWPSYNGRHRTIFPMCILGSAGHIADIPQMPCCPCFPWLILITSDVFIINWSIQPTRSGPWAIWGRQSLVTTNNYISMSLVLKMSFFSWLTHWGWVMHICVSKLTIIGSDNGLSPGWHQAIIWTNAGILLFGPLGTNFNEISIKIYIHSFKKVHFKMSSGIWQPFCLGLSVLSWCCKS